MMYASRFKRLFYVFPTIVVGKHKRSFPMNWHIELRWLMFFIGYNGN